MLPWLGGKIGYSEGDLFILALPGNDYFILLALKKNQKYNTFTYKKNV